jgi:hypothetical protein
MRTAPRASIHPRKSGLTKKCSGLGRGIPLIGYLLTCARTGAWPGSVQASGSSLSFGCPRWSCGSHLACAGWVPP